MSLRIEMAIEYARRGGQALTGDLYAPADGAPYPILVAAHGGAWRTGSAARYRHWGRWLAARGIGLFAINYRLVAERRNLFPASLMDLRAALAFVRGEAGRLGADPGRIGLMGDSAGAHLAALAALSEGRERFALEPVPGLEPGPAPLAAAVRLVVGVYGVYDLPAQWQHDLAVRPADSITEALLGASPLDDRFPFLAASPIAYASRDRRIPFLLAWGTGDTVADPATQSAAFARALVQCGAPVRTVVIPEAPHFWIDEPIEPPSHTHLLAPRLLRFAEEHL
ncbi:MAG: alpha/beta hydrolase [Dongiaceae bacterium]